MSSYNPDTQLLDFKGMINSRDLGGMPLSGNLSFLSRLFVRSAAPLTDDPKELQDVLDYGVRMVIDLRSEAELKKFGNPFRDMKEVEFHSIPLFKGDPELKDDPTMDFLRTHHLGDFYVIVAEEFGTSAVSVLRLLKDCSGTALFHCAHGKDRTGVISACLYLLAGASREDIIHNYEISYGYLKDFLAPLMAQTDDDMKHTLRSDRINMEIFLKHIDDNYGGNIRNLLRSKGMTDLEIEMLTAKCRGD